MADVPRQGRRPSAIARVEEAERAMLSPAMERFSSLVDRLPRLADELVTTLTELGNVGRPDTKDNGAGQTLA